MKLPIRVINVKLLKQLRKSGASPAEIIKAVTVVGMIVMTVAYLMSGEADGSVYRVVVVLVVVGITFLLACINILMYLNRRGTPQ